MVDHIAIAVRQSPQLSPADDRRVQNGILWRFRTVSPWAEVPERYGPPTACGNRFVRWRRVGVWDRLLEAVSQTYGGDIVMIDPSCVRVRQHAATERGGDGGSMGCSFGVATADNRWSLNPVPIGAGQGLGLRSVWSPADNRGPAQHRRDD
ncbi:transposase [Rhizobium lusitanum]|uniref:Transposase n=1 Tax=Rhizobium lusitanum TaxID=293958 RepID=A0A7X0IV40_9HYPH|nr:transposase [Rhizobium lusitanum]